MTRRWKPTAIAAVAAATGVFLSSPAPSLAENGRSTAVFGALAAAAIVALGAVPLAVRRRGTPKALWLALAAAALVVGLAAFAVEGYVQRMCTADYDGRARVIGTELTATGTTYARDNPDLSTVELLFDAAGTAERIWTPSSIARCRTAVASTHALWVPFLLLSLLGLWEATTSATIVLSSTRQPARLDRDQHVSQGGASARTDATRSAGAGNGLEQAEKTRYDAFLSYRHGGADGNVARQLLHVLEARGFRVAIDERDFPANESFLTEMERCVRESRFTIAIVSARYLDSGNCEEEAIICKVLDMGERKRRLIPVLIEAVAMPAWLYGIVGIDLTKTDPLVDPVEKLIATLGPR